MLFPDQRNDDDWREVLSQEQFRILRGGGCERPFSGEHIESKGPGVYRCVACGQDLFTAEDKMESDCGWPAFAVAAAADRVILREDHHPDYPGVEVLCSRCGGHLGHVFDEEVGQRFCINSVCLEFRPG